MKRLLDCDTSDLKKMNKEERLAAIEASEGRLLIQELSLFQQTQLLEPLSDAEIACAFGADSCCKCIWLQCSANSRHRM